jgi:hypothetical protein
VLAMGGPVAASDLIGRRVQVFLGCSVSEALKDRRPPDYAGVVRAVGMGLVMWVEQELTTNTWCPKGELVQVAAGSGILLLADDLVGPPQMAGAEATGRTLAVVWRLEATQFVVDQQPWPAGVAETWATSPAPPTRKEIREMSRHQLLTSSRQLQVDQQVVHLHAAGFAYYYWDGVRSVAMGLKPQDWIVRDGSRISINDEESFRLRFHVVGDA